MTDFQTILAAGGVLVALIVALGCILLGHWFFVQPWEPTSPELDEEIRKIFESEEGR